MIELPEPFRSDWRTAFLCNTLVHLLGKPKGRYTVKDTYDELSKFFDVLPESQDPADTEAAVRAWLPLLGAKKIREAESAE